MYSSFPIIGFSSSNCELTTLTAGCSVRDLLDTSAAWSNKKRKSIPELVRNVVGKMGHLAEGRSGSGLPGITVPVGVGLRKPVGAKSPLCLRASAVHLHLDTGEFEEGWQAPHFTFHSLFPHTGVVQACAQRTTPAGRSEPDGH